MTLQIGRQATNTFAFCPISNWLHTGELHFGTLRGAAAQVTFATFGTHNFTAAGDAEAFGSGFVRFELVLLGHRTHSQSKQGE